MKYFVGLLLGLFLTQSVFAQTSSPQAADEFDKTWDQYLYGLEHIPDKEVQLQKALSGIDGLASRIDTKKFLNVYSIIQKSKVPKGTVVLTQRYLDKNENLYDLDLTGLRTMLDHFQDQAISKDLSGNFVGDEASGDYAIVMEIIQRHLAQSFEQLSKEFASGQYELGMDHLKRLRKFAKANTFDRYDEYQYIPLPMKYFRANLEKFMERRLEKAEMEARVAKEKIRKAEAAKKAAELRIQTAQVVLYVDSVQKKLEQSPKCEEVKAESKK